MYQVFFLFFAFFFFFHFGIQMENFVAILFLLLNREHTCGTYIRVIFRGLSTISRILNFCTKHKNPLIFFSFCFVFFFIICALLLLSIFIAIKRRKRRRKRMRKCFIFCLFLFFIYLNGNTFNSTTHMNIQVSTNQLEKKITKEIPNQMILFFFFYGKSNEDVLS